MHGHTLQEHTRSSRAVQVTSDTASSAGSISARLSAYLQKSLCYVGSTNINPATKTPPLMPADACCLIGLVQTRSINSCLAPLGTLDGVQIITVEGLGNSKKGFNPVQGAAQLTSWSSLPCSVPRVAVLACCAAAFLSRYGWLT